MAEQTMVEQQHQQQHHLVEEVARTNVPTEVYNEDGNFTIDLLSQVGWIDITQPGLVFDFKTFTTYRTNNDGRIVYLDLGHGPHTRRKSDGKSVYINPLPDLSQILCWVLPNLISSLTMLQKLILRKCQTLPNNLNLPNLKWLMLHRCDEGIMNNMNETLEIALPVLRTLTISEFNLTPNNTSAVITFMKHLPSLRTLVFSDTSTTPRREKRRSCDPFLQLLRNDDCCAFLMHKLKSISISGFIMTKEELVSIFNNVLPEYPKISSVLLQNNLIETFQDVGDLIVNSSSNNNRKLTKIIISDNPVTNKLINNDENEQKAVLNILSKFDRVSCIEAAIIDGIWYSINEGGKYGPDIECALRMNRVGRTTPIENAPPPAVATTTTTITHDAAPDAPPADVTRNANNGSINIHGGTSTPYVRPTAVTGHENEELKTDQLQHRVQQLEDQQQLQKQQQQRIQELEEQQLLQHQQEQRRRQRTQVLEQQLLLQQQQQQQQREDNRCVIYFESPRSHVCVPCGHVSTCRLCSNAFMAGGNRCPICREDVQQIIQLYHP